MPNPTTPAASFSRSQSAGFTSGQGIQEFSQAGSIASLTNFVCLMTFLPLLLKLAVRCGFKLPKPSFAIIAPIPVAWFVAKRFGRPLTVLAIIVTGLLLIPYTLIQPHFSFEDMMSKGSAALTAAETIDNGVGGVAPLYVSIPLDQPDPNISDADFAKLQKVQGIVEKRLGNDTSRLSQIQDGRWKVVSEYMK